MLLVSENISFKISYKEYLKKSDVEDKNRIFSLVCGKNLSCTCFYFFYQTAFNP